MNSLKWLKCGVVAAPLLFGQAIFNDAACHKPFVGQTKKLHGEACNKLSALAGLPFASEVVTEPSSQGKELKIVKGGRPSFVNFSEMKRILQEYKDQDLSKLVEVCFYIAENITCIYQFFLVQASANYTNLVNEGLNKMWLIGITADICRLIRECWAEVMANILSYNWRPKDIAFVTEFLEDLKRLAIEEAAAKLHSLLNEGTPTALLSDTPIKRPGSVSSPQDEKDAEIDNTRVADLPVSVQELIAKITNPEFAGKSFEFTIGDWAAELKSSRLSDGKQPNYNFGNARVSGFNPWIRRLIKAVMTGAPEIKFWVSVRLNGDVAFCG